MGENNTLDRPATPDEIEMVERLLFPPRIPLAESSYVWPEEQIDA
jgi:hypothetical protein